KSVEPCAENDVLAETMVQLFQNKIFDETSPTHDRCAVAAGALRVHVGAVPPPVFGSDQLQPNLVREYLPWRINLHMHGPPKSDSYRCAVWNRHCITGHQFP